MGNAYIACNGLQMGFCGVQVTYIASVIVLYLHIRFCAFCVNTYVHHNLTSKMCFTLVITYV